jgi:hypothetical protein
MTDRPGKLEQEMRAMRPQGLREEVVDRLEAAISRPAGSWGDRCLMGAIGSGLAAACVIIAMLMIGMRTPPSSGAIASPPFAQSDPPRAGDSLMMFARVDGMWNDILK